LQRELRADPQHNVINAVWKWQLTLAFQRASYKAHLAERDGYIGGHLDDVF
jgi:hypothetical protein